MPVEYSKSKSTLFGCRLFLLFFGVATLAAASDLPRANQYFRSDAGVTRASEPLPDNLESPEALVWRVAMDTGHSTPILSGNKIFLTSFRAKSGELATVALDKTTGGELWRRPLVPKTVEQTHPIGSPATGTAACDGKRLFVFFGSHGVLCYNLEGKQL